MRASTREIVLAALRGDESVPAAMVEAVRKCLNGEAALESLDAPLLLTAGQAAKILGVGRTWFWAKLKEDQRRPPDERRFPPVEIGPGQYRYRATDVRIFANRVGDYVPAPRKQKITR